MNERTFLFIGGAPRSGTTLLTQLLDGHREMIAFPMEHGVFDSYFWLNEADRAPFFLHDFVEHRSAGQQVVLASRDHYKVYSDRIEREFGTQFDMDVKPDEFLNAYRTALRRSGATLGGVFEALVKGLAASNGYAHDADSLAKIAVFKKPYPTVICAQQVAKELSSAKFLQIIRDPYARYASAKKRRLRKYSRIWRVSRRINEEDFVTGHAEISISALHRGLENQRILGPDRYMLLKFEDLVAEPKEEMDRIRQWLDLDHDERLLRPTRLSKQVTSGSSFSPIAKVDQRASDRYAEFLELTSPSERDLYNRYLHLSEYGRFYELHSSRSESQLLSNWLRPYRYEGIKDYAWRIVRKKGRLSLDSDAIGRRLKVRLPDMFLESAGIEVGGAT